MLTELLEHNHSQQAGARPAPRNDMEWRRRLTDLLAVPAGKLLPHCLEYLPLTADRFQRARHVLAKLAQTIAPTARTRRRRIDQHALAGKIVRQCNTCLTLRRQPPHRLP